MPTNWLKTRTRCPPATASSRSSPRGFDLRRDLLLRQVLHPEETQVAAGLAEAQQGGEGEHAFLSALGLEEGAAASWRSLV